MNVSLHEDPNALEHSFYIYLKKMHKYSTGTDGHRTIGRSPRTISYRSPLAGVLFSLQSPANSGNAPVSSADTAPISVFPPQKQRRPGPDKPRRGIPPENWPDVLRRIEQDETLRQIAKAYGVSYETVRRTVKAAHKREGEK